MVKFISENKIGKKGNIPETHFKFTFRKKIEEIHALMI